MSRLVIRCVVVLAMAMALSVAQVPVVVIPSSVALVAAPQPRRRPVRGPSRDRSLPGKARRQARRQR